MTRRVCRRSARPKPAVSRSLSSAATMSPPFASAWESICLVKSTCVDLASFSTGTFVGSSSGGVLTPRRATRRRRSGSGTAAIAARRASSVTRSRPPQCRSTVRMWERSSRASGPLDSDPMRLSAVARGTIAVLLAVPVSLLLFVASAPPLGCLLLGAGAFGFAWAAASSLALASARSVASAWRMWSAARQPFRSLQFGSAAARSSAVQTGRSLARTAAKRRVSPLRSHAFMSTPLVPSLAISSTSPLRTASCNSRERYGDASNTFCLWNLPG
mmetsp:Transcript_19438/g.54838  ORF Transcript_19438/g.54838 Transcript_19438/m.54838 type:complete len:273 (+) Transcript_19438:246-1064(+)